MSGTIQTVGHTLAQFDFKSHDTLSLVVLSTSKRLGHWGINRITDLLTAAVLVLEPDLFSASNGHFQGQAQPRCLQNSSDQKAVQGWWWQKMTGAEVTPVQLLNWSPQLGFQPINCNDDLWWVGRWWWGYPAELKWQSIMKPQEASYTWLVSIVRLVGCCVLLGEGGTEGRRKKGKGRCSGCLWRGWGV